MQVEEVDEAWDEIASKLHSRTALTLAEINMIYRTLISNSDNSGLPKLVQELKVDRENLTLEDKEIMALHVGDDHRPAK